MEKSEYIFPTAQQNIERLAELRRIIAEDPELNSVSDEVEFRRELAALREWEWQRTALTYSEPVTKSENRLGAYVRSTPALFRLWVIALCLILPVLWVAECLARGWDDLCQCYSEAWSAFKAGKPID
jgi:hypothetical protein